MAEIPLDQTEKDVETGPRAEKAVRATAEIPQLSSENLFRLALALTTTPQFRFTEDGEAEEIPRSVRMPALNEHRLALAAHAITKAVEMQSVETLGKMMKGGGGGGIQVLELPTGGPLAKAH